ncbi:hypothetical protein EYF80_003516 [Liparis tanakae]|uniref:Uncharacterized protein n=1 Tax=Liparis tanakae TaxID=230148 RepID=A0A4Z2J7D3_9TELE|nr:hypothetical protein EYF80_003516 [Liparis tanakae]
MLCWWTKTRVSLSTRGPLGALQRVRRCGPNLQPHAADVLLPAEQRRRRRRRRRSSRPEEEQLLVGAGLSSFSSLSSLSAILQTGRCQRAQLEPELQVLAPYWGQGLRVGSLWGKPRTVLLWIQLYGIAFYPKDHDWDRAVKEQTYLRADVCRRYFTQETIHAGPVRSIR